MQEALNQKIDAFIAANKEQLLKDIAALVSINSCLLYTSDAADEL